MSALPAIYLDYAATTPLDPRVWEAMAPFALEAFANPASLHEPGKRAKRALDDARHRVATCLGGVDPSTILWTGGGTEADNLGVLGIARALKEKGRHVVTSAAEHAAVLEACQALEREGFAVTYLPTNAVGQVEPQAVVAALRPDTVLVAVMHGNNEVGALNDLPAIGVLCRERGVHFHVDAVQTVGKLPLDLASLPVDSLAVSAHKFYGPKGVGFLYLAQGAVRPVPLAFGGGQETGLRPGTVNVAGAVGLAMALELALETAEAEAQRLRDLARRLLDGLHERLPGRFEHNGPPLEQGVPGIVNVSFPPLEGETLVIKLAMRGIAVSSGSACHSERIEPSHVVLAMGKPEAVTRGTVRFSMGKGTGGAEVVSVLDALGMLLPKLLDKRRPA